MITPTLTERLERNIKRLREQTFDDMPTTIKIHQKDAKEAATWGMKFRSRRGEEFTLEVLGQTKTVSFA